MGFNLFFICFKHNFLRKFFFNDKNDIFNSFIYNTSIEIPLKNFNINLLNILKNPFYTLETHPSLSTKDESYIYIDLKSGLLFKNKNQYYNIWLKTFKDIKKDQNHLISNYNISNKELNVLQYSRGEFDIRYDRTKKINYNKYSNDYNPLWRYWSSTRNIKDQYITKEFIQKISIQNDKDNIFLLSYKILSLFMAMQNLENKIKNNLNIPISIIWKIKLSKLSNSMICIDFYNTERKTLKYVYKFLKRIFNSKSSI